MKKHFFKWFVIILVLTAFSACKKEAKTSIDTAESVQSLQTAEKIDIDFTNLNYNMASALIFDMLANQEDYLGKRIKIKGQFFASQDDFGSFLAVLLYDATACCQTGFTFEDDSRHYPEDYPALLEDIEIVGVYSKKYYGDTEFAYIDCGKSTTSPQSDEVCCSQKELYSGLIPFVSMQSVGVSNPRHE